MCFWSKSKPKRSSGQVMRFSLRLNDDLAPAQVVASLDQVTAYFR
jgi:hypothetical protein